MKSNILIFVFILLGLSLGWSEVVFYDSFDRPDGPVANGWVNVGTSLTSIENNAMKVVSDNGKGIRHDFTEITSGVYYIQYDWKIQSNDWYADAFPTGVTTHIIVDDSGNLCYDIDGTMSNPIIMQNITFGNWMTVKLKVNLDTDRFSIWINDVLIVDNIQGMVVNSFSRFTFRAGLGSNIVQYVDNFFVLNEVPPTLPTGLNAVGNVNNITLIWNASDVTDFLEYRIYRGTTSPATTLLTSVPGTQNQFIDMSAIPNIDNFYRITAIILKTNESSFSEEASAHLQPQALITPIELFFNTGFGYSDSTYITITNTGNYELNWEINSFSYPIEGLVTRYIFDGNTINDTGDSQYDAINHGAFFTSDRFGNPNSALDFNGTDSYLQLSNNITFEQEMAISCWVYQRSSSGAPGIVSRYPAWSLLGNSTPGARFFSNGDFHTLESNFSLYEWHHIVVMADLSSKWMYIDGNLTASNAYGGVANGVSDTYIGKYFESGYFWDGKIDDVFIYDRKLSENEIQVLLNSGNRRSNNYMVFPTNGTINSLEQQLVKVKLFRTDLSVGTHLDTLSIETDDPILAEQPLIITTTIHPPLPELILTSNVMNLNYNNPTLTIPVSLVNHGLGKLYYTIMGYDSWSTRFINASDHNFSKPELEQSYFNKYKTPSTSISSIHARDLVGLDRDSEQSILSFYPFSGVIDGMGLSEIIVMVSGELLDDGIYTSSVILSSNAETPIDILSYPLTINVDYTPPLFVEGLINIDAQTDANQIAISWNANAIADSVRFYKIFRKGRDEMSWRLLSTVDLNTLDYIDRAFTPMDSTYFWYQVSAVDWVGNEGPVSENLMATLKRFLAPENMNIDIINNLHVYLTWNPVTHTISGMPGIPSCYIIYKSEHPLPLSDFDFLAISTTPDYTHQYAAYFQPQNKLFYIVTAYGGDVPGLRAIADTKKTWKYRELDTEIRKQHGFLFKN